ncbi:MAG: class I poly(R)-hydroxyalkanoic acid synthase [Burkholderiales bacterium]|nr:class I poly(R)-hydroxyalkanoic acid synthase [Burkholderiales bacterium]
MTTPAAAQGPHLIKPDVLAEALSDVARRAAALAPKMAERQAADLESALADEFGVQKAFGEVMQKMLADPNRLIEAQTRYVAELGGLWQTYLAAASGGARPEPIKDRRFADEAWQSNPWFDFLARSYTLTARHMQDAVAAVPGVSPQTRHKALYYTRQMLDAAAPSNFPLTNPQVLKATAESGGENLIKGLKNMVRDLEKGKGGLAIAMTDTNAFEMGRNVASTPGKVVFQNDLMQLLQYQPATTTVLKRPLLIIPPWINKYYILDLQPKNSFIKWAVDQGHTVFVISWVMPDAKLARKTFDDYLLEGPVAAMDAIARATGEREVNAIGYCLGGTLLACALGYLTAKKDNRIRSATFFTSLIDFSKPGDLGVYVDEAQVDALERRMQKRGGYLEGSEMAGTFNMLRANDLIWSFYVHNYLLGKDPFPFDLLYWNSDATRMPMAMHLFYLREMYIKNKLVVPGGVTLAGTPLDLSKVKTPAYFISTVEDHIAPWATTYTGARVLGGPNKFVLGGSGHIAGIVNPPAAKKYGYWTNDKLVASAEDWLAGATRHEGSWWTDWDQWIRAHNRERPVAARVPGNPAKGGKLKALEDAPGSFAKLRLDKQA